MAQMVHREKKSPTDAKIDKSDCCVMDYQTGRQLFGKISFHCFVDLAQSMMVYHIVRLLERNLLF